MKEIIELFGWLALWNSIGFFIVYILSPILGLQFDIIHAIIVLILFTLGFILTFSG